MNISLNKFSKGTRTTANATIDTKPDTCPICHYAGEQEIVSQAGIINTEGVNGWIHTYAEIPMLCPKTTCRSLYITYYRCADPSYVTFRYSRSQPKTQQTKEISQDIKDISTKFDEIYSQAQSAEGYDLMEIAGVGYRKSLEFLIKDYIISQDSEIRSTIEDKQLGACIKDHVTNESIKDIASRAAWLGNDETHYVRKWADKDMQDLKQLIDVTLHWIEMDILTKRIIDDMQAGKKAQTETAQPAS